MSLAARTIDAVPQKGPASGAPARRRPTRSAAAPSPRTVPSAGRARSFPLAFAALLLVVVTALGVGVVALNVVVAQAGFRVTALQADVRRLSARYTASSLAAARLSSPERLSAWAATHGMVEDANPVILRVSGRAGASVPAREPLSPSVVAANAAAGGGG